jgi:hypothetical protein
LKTENSFVNVRFEANGAFSFQIIANGANEITTNDIVADTFAYVVRNISGDHP